MATQIGVVKALIGEVTATAADGSIRTLQVGDRVYADELITTGAAGAVEIEFADGSIMDLGRSSQALLDSEVFDPSAPIIAESDADVPDDVAAIQQALLEGADPTELAEATAAGAGVEGGNEGHEAVFVDYLGPQVTPDAGFDTVGVTNEFDLPEEDIIILDEEEPLPVVSVSVEVEIDVEDPQNPPPSDGEPTEDFPVIVNGNAVNVLEGTDGVNGGGETRDVTFLITLSEVFDQDVQVTYELRPISADHPDDWFNGSLTDTVTIPAGTTSFPVTITIVQDHLDEGDESFEIMLLSATNATINPDADSAIVTIFDDDTTPVANDDSNQITDNSDEIYSVDGNVLDNDTDEDGDADPGNGVLEVLNAPIVINHEYGTLTIQSDGSYSFALNSVGIDYLVSLGEGVEGDPINFVDAYQVSDGVNDGNFADLTINLQGVNDLDDADEAANTDEDTPVSAPNLLANVTDPDVGDTHSITQFQVAGDGTVYTAGQTAVMAGVGSLTINANGTYTFTPEADYNGDVPVATYTVTDGTDTNDSTLTITINPVNDLDDADEAVNTDEDTPVSAPNLLANVTDP
ncbi:retention module-containing protein, partial [Methylophaga sp. OBS4]|uniref:retention module-containing protein n=1 Tax=Methylophaga sp. OBS4 TaxID=2991935 RepID=UPI002252B254